MYVVIFILLDDEDQNQVINNILQIKQRGATIILLTNLPNIEKRMNVKDEVDHLISLPPQTSILSALLCTTPLMMLVYYTALAKGLNPDQNIIDSININSELQIEF